MADTSLNENRLALLIWQTSNLWQSKVRHKLKKSQITLNEYLILETIYLLQEENINITQQDICLLYTSPSPRDISGSRMPSSA